VASFREWSLSDADVERLLKEAVDFDSLEERDDLYYQVNESEPYSGWVKEMWDSEQLRSLGQAKDGKRDGLYTLWNENGQKRWDRTFKDGEFVK
jgi:antitoxin component YwqK of YwqJK toxin-antitoxin module